ncbi:Uma2 family endonuclease [Prochlorothrix hollandica]|uniref:Putative restriction endonuclease domain-containing protein n=1 Tax=Prochlorothrix hollandica PCC 9006 = CALU 1027 TaxID=317619 RepID=A0A0M2PXN4_PROHO|nr:Uma2 family endonuclease [Prochlorothrix hollandica]KKI99146.1 hypothetical protein PROH_15345 [Prochlorothrix hollandica PCC 9006 = CALU 1027]
MAIAFVENTQNLLTIRWEMLPDDFILPDDPVESNLQPLLAAALREALELAGRIPANCLIASNFGLCATVEDKTVVKAPDWVYVPTVLPLAPRTIRRSYTPHLEGDVPGIVMEFISETEGGEYSIKPYYPYGKWFFYGQILRVPIYVIFEPQGSKLDVYQLQDGQYRPLEANEEGRYWLPSVNLFLGIWQGQKAEMTASWLRWWDQTGSLLLWGSEQVDQERQRAEQERQRAERSEERLKALEERMRSLGLDEKC